MARARAAAADPLLAEVATLWQAGEAVVLIHGGGPEIDAALARRNWVLDGMARHARGEKLANVVDMNLGY